MAAGLLMVAMCGYSTAVAATLDRLEVVVRPGQTLRQIASDYLGDPNLWHEIVRASDLGSAAEVEPGTVLLIPRTEVSVAARALDSAAEKIREATEAGARVFAGDTIDAAVDARREAIEERRAGRWDACRDAAARATDLAGRALSETKAARAASAEAVLRNGTGRVEGRRSVDLVWSPRDPGSLLVESEKLRTLSASSALVMFADASNLRLGPNSQAVIQSLRVDRLNGREEAKVSLVEGEVYALLDGGGSRRGLEVQVPGVTTDSISTDFWIRRDGGETKIANYDARGMKVSSAGSTVELARNQGTRVASGVPPTAPQDLLAAPVPSAPDQDAQLGGATTVMRWTAVHNAHAYAIDVATDAAFATLLSQQSDLDATQLVLWNLTEGTYYWRVAAVDDAGFPGPRSPSQRFRVRRPRQPPFLAIDSPRSGQILRTRSVVVAGRAQPRSRLFVRGQPVRLMDDGSFRHQISLHEGANMIRIELITSTEDRARRTLNVMSMPDRDASLEIDTDLPTDEGGRLVTAAERLQVTGAAAPGARLAVIMGGLEITSAFADAGGGFGLEIPVTTEPTTATIAVELASGQRHETKVTVIRDVEPPRIVMETEVPERTSAPQLDLRGRVEGASCVRLNGAELALDGGRFSTRLALPEGSVEIRIEATDTVGNQSPWTRTVVVDRTPPTIERVVLRPSATPDPTQDLMIEVVATDSSPMRRTGRATVRVGMTPVEVPLVRDGSSSTWVGRVGPAGEISGPAAVEYVVIEDVVGNRSTTPHAVEVR
jgi:hypothetical protein